MMTRKFPMNVFALLTITALVFSSGCGTLSSKEQNRRNGKQVKLDKLLKKIDQKLVAQAETDFPGVK